MRNHFGTYECKLCLAFHPNEANYLSHTQGTKPDETSGGVGETCGHGGQVGETEGRYRRDDVIALMKAVPKVKIGRPGYEVSKSRDPETNGRCLAFELHYPELDDARSRHVSYMSAYEQRVETPPDKNYQYLLVACDPYETVAFKIPNEQIDREQEKFVTNWDVDAKVFTLT
jgi:splicing factor 3A subunit 2